MASSTTSSSAAITIAIILLIVGCITESPFRIAIDVNATAPECSGNIVGQAYNNDVVNLITKLQLKAGHSPTKPAKLKVRCVAGKASCDSGVDENGCLSCLGWAEIDLANYCKGRESGTSNGTGHCKMSFHRA